VISHKRTERLYSEEGLVLRRKRRRKGAAGSRVMMPAAQRLNQRWSMDFVTDSIVTGRRFRALAIVDDYSWECPASFGLESPLRMPMLRALSVGSGTSV
jgi:putative transposase